MDLVIDDIDLELLPLFLEEADELYPRIDRTLQDLLSQPSEQALARKLQRSLHTFKGSARMAGAMRVGELIHRLEERASANQDNRELWQEIQSEFKQIGNMIGLLRNDFMRNGSLLDFDQQRVPFVSISKRLQHIVQQLCKQLDKQANFQLHGTEVKLQSNVLDELTSTFEHLLRNALAHGLEAPLQRAIACKPPVGSIRLSLRQEYDELVFEFMDDGAGLDTDGLRRKAIKMGLIPENKPLTRQQAMELIFVPGLSTVTAITEIAGRGVGMDVVRSDVSSLGGDIIVSSGRGEGTCFIIRLPV